MKINELVSLRELLRLFYDSQSPNHTRFHKGLNPYNKHCWVWFFLQAQAQLIQYPDDTKEVP